MKRSIHVESQALPELGLALFDVLSRYALCFFSLVVSVANRYTGRSPLRFFGCSSKG